MDLVVCLKQVPDTETQIKVGADGNSIDDNEIKWVMNPYDEFGVEEAIKIREAKGGEVTVISVGPTRATEALRTALAMGADKAVLIDDEGALGGDSYATAKVMAAALKDMPCDICFAGMRAVDDDRGQFASILGGMLNVPALTVVTGCELGDDGTVTVKQPVEGQAMMVKASLPAVISTQKGLNEPRYASLPGIMKAKKKPLETKTLADLGLDAAEVGAAGSLIEVLSMTPPPAREGGKVVEGDTPEDKAAALADLLMNEAKVV